MRRYPAKGKRLSLKHVGDGCEQGFTLLEVIIAISILTFGLLAVASMQVSSIRGNALAGGVTEGTTWASDKLEKLISLPYTHADLAAGAHTEATPPPGYTITWNVADDAPMDNTKTVTVTVRWSQQGTQKTVSLQHVVPRIV